jgi:hypothetical protein
VKDLKRRRVINGFTWYYLDKFKHSKILTHSQSRPKGVIYVLFGYSTPNNKRPQKDFVQKKANRVHKIKTAPREYDPSGKDEVGNQLLWEAFDLWQQSLPPPPREPGQIGNFKWSPHGTAVSVEQNGSAYIFDTVIQKPRDFSAFNLAFCSCYVWATYAFMIN